MNDSVPAGPLNIRTRVRIGAEGVPPEKLREIVDWADHHSPVADAVKRAVPGTLDIEVL
jgi:hypothetical protein